MKKALIPLWILTVIAGTTSGQNMDDKVLKIQSCMDFTIDGKGTASEWEQIDWVPLNPLNAETAYETEVKVLYSSTGIYFLFRNEDTKITATLNKDNTDLYNEDVVEVFLWTDEDYPMYFEYELSPLNYQLPILIPKVGSDFFGWLPWHYEEDRITRHNTHIETAGESVKGWTGEFFIPYKLLRPLGNVPPQVGTRWRANMYRIDYDQDQPVWWAWQPIVNNFHDHELFGVFEFN